MGVLMLNTNNAFYHRFDLALILSHVFAHAFDNLVDFLKAVMGTG